MNKQTAGGIEMSDPKDAELLIETRGVYDGWSVAVMPDGTFVNRWPEDDPRHKRTQDWLDDNPTTIAVTTL